LVLSERTVQTHGRARWTWLAIGSLSLGITAAVLSGTTIVVAAEEPVVRYAATPAIIVLSLGIAAVCFALTMLLVVERSRLRALAGSLGAGAALAIMHFTAMTAIGWAGIFSFDPRFAGAAVVAASLAIMLAVQQVAVVGEGSAERDGWRRGLIGLLMLTGLAGGYLTSFAAAGRPAPTVATP